MHFLSGKVSLARGRLAEAREHQEQALAFDPAHSGAMNELGRIRLRRHDTAGAIRHFISAARATPEERIYSRNIDVVLLRTVSRTIYVFTLIALILIWIPAVTHLDRMPFVIALGCSGAHRGLLRLDRAADAARGPADWSAGRCAPPGSRRPWPWRRAASGWRSAWSRLLRRPTWPRSCRSRW